MRDVVVLGFFLSSLPFCFFRPFYGILLWTIVAFVNPQHLAYGYASTFPLAEAVAIPTLAGFLVFNRGWQRLASREFLLVVTLWIWFTVTTLVSVHASMFEHHAADTWYRWEFVSKILLMTMVSICLIDSFKRLRIFLLVIAGCFGLFVAKDLPFTILTGGEFRLYGPAASMIADNNDFGLALNMTVPLFFFLARTESNRLLKRVLYGLFLASIPAVFFTYSRGALVGLVAVSFLMFLQMRQRLALILVIVLTVAFALVLLRRCGVTACQHWATTSSILRSWSGSMRGLSRGASPTTIPSREVGSRRLVPRCSRSMPPTPKTFMVPTVSTSAFWQSTASRGYSSTCCWSFRPCSSPSA